MNRHDPSVTTPPEAQEPPMPVVSVQMSDRVWTALLARSAPSRTAWSPAERAAWDLYAPLRGAGDRPFVFAQIGQSLDGRVATAAGDAADISGLEGLKHLHRCRAMADCVIVGVTTAIQDDPRLTVRLVEGENPARVVIDPNGRLGDDAALMAGRGERCLIVQGCDRERPVGVETVKVARSGRGLDPASILGALIERGFRRILIEGGGITIGHFMDADLVDRLHVAISPLIIGAGPASLTTSPISLLSQAKRPPARVYGLETDIVIDCDLRG